MSLGLRKRIEDKIAGLSWRARWVQLNKVPGIWVAREAWVDKEAKVTLTLDGYARPGAISIAAGARILAGAIVSPYGGSIEIGENVSINPYCVIYGQGGLVIGRDTMIAAHTVIIPSNHGFADRSQTIFSQPCTSRGIRIGEDVWVGCGVRILDGVTIGRGCVIGAGAVVTRSIPDYAIAVGVPARVIGYRGEETPALMLVKG